VIDAAHTGALDYEARELAGRHRLSARPPTPLASLDRVDRLVRWIARARQALRDAEAADAKAAEWLIDNEYLVVRAIRQVAEDMPAGFYRRLPALDQPGLRPPRVQAVARGLMAASRLQLSLPTVTLFVEAYQSRTPLTIAELWALPTFLRLECLERLVAALVRIRPSLEPPVPVDAVPAIAIDDTEAVGRAISNLRTIATISWKDFFCRTSRLEAALGGDPAGVYAQMDFETRDRYRRTIEDLSRRSRHGELDVAAALLREADPADGPPRRRHLGYWLIDDGLEDFERALGCRTGVGRRVRRWAVRHAVALYALVMAVAIALALVFPVAYALRSGASAPLLILVLLAALLPASTLGITVVHWLITIWLPPRILPKLDFEAGIPADCRTAVVIPTLVTSIDDAHRQLERLEMHYVSNPGPGTQFVLLSDFTDAPAEHLQDDAPLLEALAAGVRRLNRKHAAQPFHVFHRPRLFNPREGVWMAWERKRGKLEQFNRLVVEGRDDAFTLHEGVRAALDDVRFVVTLDADTVLPRGALPRLVGGLAHPLNRAEFDERTGRVRAGYTVIQPRVEVSPESGKTRFARWFTGDTAIDIYSRAVSDVYQDLFGAGVYVGKGIYEVRAFSRSLEGRVPENALASHDLFEGIHGRVALATDIVLYEGFPSQYLEFTRRQHRWIRGDWQLLPWLGRTVPGAGGRRLPNRFRGIDRWKIVDNLRRSLLAPSLVAMFVAGWLTLPGHPAVWTLLGVLAPAGHIFTDLVTGLARGRRRKAVATLGARMTDQLGRWFLLLLFLPYDAFVALDAIARTLVRVFITRRRLLQWTTAARTAEVLARAGPAAVWLAMWTAPAAALAALWATAVWNPAALPYALPLTALWSLAPDVARRLGRPIERRPRRLERRDRLRLRHIARRTWRYFEVFAGPDDNWLPPDNVQEGSRGGVAHRTSPTNIGMMFLSTLAACDLGYLGLEELSSRLGNSFESLDRLERHRGHFLNWYDTRTLESLSRKYVSTVDSGNLGVSLLAVRTACVEMADGPAIRAALWDGVQDVIGLLSRSARDLVPGDVDAVRRRSAAAARHLIGEAREHPLRWWRALQQLRDGPVAELDRALTETSRRDDAGLAELREVGVWLERLHHHIRSFQREFELLCPWIAVLDRAPVACLGLATELAAVLPPTTPLAQAASRLAQVRGRLQSAPASVCPDDSWRAALLASLDRAERSVPSLRADLTTLAGRAERVAMEMDFSLLYDADARLFHIGYNLNADRLDEHHYDLLASEARLASLFAIAKGDAPVEHWFHLGRPVTHLGGRRGLISWGGSMFEYLMPPLLMRSEPGTLLAESERMAVEAQRRHGRAHQTPWGTSESAFAETDPDGMYRYRSFGTPTLGFRQGLSDDLVVAPYASVLALGVEPGLAMQNIRRLETLGLVGPFGPYEAADFTPERLPAGRRFVAVRSYMAHHQGMILAAIDNALSGDVLVRRTIASALLRSVSLLLHERVPTELPTESVIVTERMRRQAVRGPLAPPAAWAPVRRGAFPELQPLGNGRLSSWISDSGAGVLGWHDWNLTRWLSDPAKDETGLWVYIRDEDTGAVWSVSRQPCGAAADAVDVLFSPHLVEFHRRDADLGMRLEIAVAPDDDLEIRRLTLVNDANRTRRLTVTTCAEVVLARVADHERHPVFSRLFVETEFLSDVHGIRCSRRPRSPDEEPPHLLHWFVSDDGTADLRGFETDRSAFLGRLRTWRDGDGTVRAEPASEGYTLDPVVALRVVVELPPRGTSRVGFATAAAGSREAVVDLARRYQTLGALDWVMEGAGSEAARELVGLQIDPGRLRALQTLGSLLVYRHPALRCEAGAIARNRLGQPHLWGMGLSGDAPLLLVKVRNAAELDELRILLAAHALWTRRGLTTDLVVLHEGTSGYEEEVGGRLRGLLAGLGLARHLGERGGVHVVHADLIGPAGCQLLEVVAHATLRAGGASLEAQLANVHVERPTLPTFVPAFAPVEAAGGDGRAEPGGASETLVGFNGFGGFTEDGREYVIHLQPGDATPAPWCNVLANDEFGTLVTEAGGGFTWSRNSAEFRLTPWTNDPVSDPAGEACYLRDEETAQVWTPTPRPAGAPVAHQVRHGAGYTSWQTRSHGVSQDLCVFVPPGDAVKIVRLRLHNDLERPRRITATYFADLVLGGSRPQGRALIATEYEPQVRAIVARNPWTPAFADQVAFLTSTREPHTMTTDRREFIGREGTLERPAALGRWGFSGAMESAAEPCAALQVHLELDPGGDTEVVFLLGAAATREEALALAGRYRSGGEVDAAWRRLTTFWEARLSAVEVETPDAAMNVMLNRWLLYQALASRLMARTGFYQSSGAIGFRDQLQDCLAFVAVEPDRCRTHLLRCAACQFEEGDVLHWWHPPRGRGVRTRCSDDLLWLPYAVAHYVEATADETVLDEIVPFLAARPLGRDEDERYAVFEAGAQTGTIFEHCARALERGVTRGPNGLPLMQAGDWNDGMNRVGRLGRGESVWLAWFAIDVMNRFAGLCVRRDERDLADRWRRRARELAQIVEQTAWDGAWYRRAFDDQGRPWGSQANSECQIDAIAQSWAVLSGGGSPARTTRALEAVARRLIDDEHRLVRLLDPPFVQGQRDPGYISAYPPGIRENGGQYTHAAVWTSWAFAQLGEADRAAAVFDLLNPATHSRNRAEAERYRVEPYVIAADISGVAPHLGRGGWTWYTGSAAWMWRLGVERILGLRLEGGRLRLDPCLPRHWRRVRATLRRPGGSLLVAIDNPDGATQGIAELRVDGVPEPSGLIAFPTDGRERVVTARLGVEVRT
jgi:cyclic beta-1,2-glucan synthetase